MSSTPLKLRHQLKIFALTQIAEVEAKVEAEAWCIMNYVFENRSAGEGKEDMETTFREAFASPNHTARAYKFDISLTLSASVRRYVKRMVRTLSMKF